MSYQKIVAASLSMVVVAALLANDSSEALAQHLTEYMPFMVAASALTGGLAVGVCMGYLRGPISVHTEHAFSDLCYFVKELAVLGVIWAAIVYLQRVLDEASLLTPTVRYSLTAGLIGSIFGRIAGSTVHELLTDTGNVFSQAEEPAWFEREDLQTQDQAPIQAQDLTITLQGQQLRDLASSAAAACIM